MRCGHCKERGVNVAHVRACSAYESGLRSIGTGEPILPRPAPVIPAPRPVTEPGVYFDGERYYKVVWNQSQTHLYAKVWDAEWTYAPGAMKVLTADMRVTAEQAAKFGQLWGSCVFCSRLLTDERSVSVGYGPVCAEKNSLPWGEAA